MSRSESEQVEQEQRVLARWERRQEALRGRRAGRLLRGLPLFLWGAGYSAVGLAMVSVGLTGSLAGWSPFSFGPDSGYTPWWSIGVEGTVPLCLGCLVLFAMVVLTSRRERRLAWRLCLWLGVAATALLGVFVIPYIVVGFLTLGWGYLLWDVATLLLFAGPPTVSVMAWRRIHTGSTQPGRPPLHGPAY